jgi:hypothetical protein
MTKHFDFTFQKFIEILDCFQDNGYSFQSLEDYLKAPDEKVVILRHDVDRSPLNSLNTARLENSKGIRGTYYFRSVKESNNPEVIREIAKLGHEIGYHYEDVSLEAQRQKTKGKRQKSIAKGTGQRAQGKEENSNNYERCLAELAIKSFKKNLSKIREIAPVRTICMHGSPMSRWDSRILWKYYDYRDFGIIGEPYFDVDFNKVLYLTDTGRKWNGDKSSVRDKVFQEKFEDLKVRLKSSDNILAAVSAKEFPPHLMITVHPQRWSDDLFIWTCEYVTQTLKNTIKSLIFVQ